VTTGEPAPAAKPPTQQSGRPTTPGTVSQAPAVTPSPTTPPEDPFDAPYRRAKDAFDGGRYAEAIPLLRSLQSQRPNYRDTATLLAESERQQARAAGRQAMDQGARLEASGNLRGAAEQYDRASQLDPSSKDSADAASRRVKGVMRTASADAMKRADLNYALDRVADAIKFYEQALNNMLNDDPARRTVEARLTELRARK
jgi:tetratricopeptide (TPR) repeat protein